MRSDRTSMKARAAPSSASMDKDSVAARLADTLFAIALNAAACRQWLSQDPPRLDEVDSALHGIAAATSRFQIAQLSGR